jgi:hypothetical protein
VLSFIAMRVIKLARLPLVPLLPALLLLGGCGGSWYEPPGAIAGFNAAAIPVIHRDLFDAVYSAVTGRDCSIVHLDDGKNYCTPLEPPIAPPAYCTHSLADVDCWSSPAVLPLPQRGVADQPALTPAQEADRVAPWPKSLR